MNNESETVPELLLCPFCGSGEIKHSIYMSAGCMECENCGCIGPEVTPDYDIEAAAKAWNTRAG